MSKYCGIYAIVHATSGSIYVGHSIDITRRWAAHRRLLNCGRHHSPRLQNAWSKYGADAFEFLRIEACQRAELVAREQFYFDELKPAFNAAPVAGSRLGVPQSAEAKEKIRHAVAGRKRSVETCAKLSSALKGRKLSPEHCDKIREIKSKVSAETRAKLAAVHLGRKASAETKAKMSVARKGRQLSADHRARLSEAMKGRTFTPETRARMSAANNTRGRKHSAEARANMRAAAIAREASKRGGANGDRD